MTQFPKLLEWSCTYAKLQISIFAPDLLYLCSFTILFLLLIKLSSLLTSFSPFLGFIWLFYGVFLNEDIVHKALFFFQQIVFSSVQSLSHVQLFVTAWTTAHQAFLSITDSWSLLKLMSIKLMIPFNYLILLSPSPPAFNLSHHQGLFQWVDSSHQVAKVLEFQL